LHTVEFGWQFGDLGTNPKESFPRGYKSSRLLRGELNIELWHIPCADLSPLQLGDSALFLVIAEKMGRKSVMSLKGRSLIVTFSFS